MAPLSGMPPTIGPAPPPLLYGPDGWGLYGGREGSFRLWLRARMTIHIAKAATMHSRAKPPITPPTMAPTGVEELDDDEVSEDVWAGLELVSVGGWVPVGEALFVSVVDVAVGITSFALMRT